VHEHIISKNLGIVVLASYENNVIAGAVFFHFGEKAVFKYGASDRNFHYLRPNNLVMWEAIKRYSQNGYKSICFGRTEPANAGLRQFKAGWGTKEKIEKYYKYNLRKNEFVKDSREIKKIYQQIFRKLPLPFLSKIGSLLYRHVG
jgi:lipid II:glycine glycyltransferase (peptidoglycan interpeptide bridge formation enzyme)